MSSTYAEDRKVVIPEEMTAMYHRLGDHSQDFRNQNLYNLIVRLLTAGHTIKEISRRRVLDLGCGSGMFLKRLKQIGYETVFGVEPERSLWEKARERLGPTIFLGDARVMAREEFPSFDDAILLDVLEHLEHDLQSLQVLFNRMRPGGRVILCVPQYPWLFGIRDKQMGHYRRYTRGGLQFTLISSGFELCHLRNWNALGVAPYWLSERVFHRPLYPAIREERSFGLVSKTLRNVLDAYFRRVENGFDFGFGLSIIAVAEKPASSA